MASELKNVLDQIEADVATISGVITTQLGQPVTSLPDTDESNAHASVFAQIALPAGETYLSTTEHHIIIVRFYWLLTTANVETVEQNLALMWDKFMEKFVDTDQDRNLSEQAVIVEVGPQGTLYSAGYELVSDKLHRVLSIPLSVTLETHVAGT